MLISNLSQLSFSELCRLKADTFKETKQEIQLIIEQKHKERDQKLEIIQKAIDAKPKRNHSKKAAAAIINNRKWKGFKKPQKKVKGETKTKA